MIFGAIAILAVVGIGVYEAWRQYTGATAPPPSPAPIGGTPSTAAPPADQIPGGLGAPMYGAPATVPAAKVHLLAKGIATAEGEYAQLSSPDIPQRANNPGDLTRSWGHATNGIANAEGVLIFASPADGWAALYDECNAMLDGSSSVYSLNDTFELVATKWTGSDNASAWAQNVCDVIGMQPTQTLGDFLFS